MPLALRHDNAGAIAATVTARVVNDQLEYSVFFRCQALVEPGFPQPSEAWRSTIIEAVCPIWGGIFTFVGETCAAAATVT